MKLLKSWDDTFFLSVIKDFKEIIILSGNETYLKRGWNCFLKGNRGNIFLKWMKINKWRWKFFKWDEIFHENENLLIWMKIFINGDETIFKWYKKILRELKLFLENWKFLNGYETFSSTH